MYKQLRKKKYPFSEAPPQAPVFIVSYVVELREKKEQVDVENAVVREREREREGEKVIRRGSTFSRTEMRVCVR